MTARSGAGAVSFNQSLGYDRSGNLTNDGTFSYRYDDADRLVESVEHDLAGFNTYKTEFSYDALSRVRIAREFDWVGGVWQQVKEQRFVYDGMNVIEERDQTNAVSDGDTLVHV